MDKAEYRRIEEYMISCMEDAAHDVHHIYRVLGQALSLTSDYEVDYDILIASCLLHDIGRKEEKEGLGDDHAQIGGVKAEKFLVSIGWSEERAAWVRECITSHRFRKDRKPETIEAKLLFDSDKLDVIGAIGISRTLLFAGSYNIPLYYLDSEGHLLEGTEKTDPDSFFREYNFKMKRVPDQLNTPKARSIAKQRISGMEAFVAELKEEVVSANSALCSALEHVLT